MAATMATTTTTQADISVVMERSMCGRVEAGGSVCMTVLLREGVERPIRASGVGLLGGLDGEGDVLGGQVVVDGDRCGRALAGSGDDLGPGADGVAGTPHPGGAGAAGAGDVRD